MENEENQHPKPHKGCKRRKGKRSYFYRTKNDERKRLKNLAGRKVLADLELNSTTGCSDSVPIAESADSNLFADCFDSIPPMISTPLTDPTTFPDHFDPLPPAITHDPDPTTAPDHPNPALTPGHSDPIMLTSCLDSIPLVPSVTLPDHTNLIPSATLSDTSSSNERIHPNHAFDILTHEAKAATLPNNWTAFPSEKSLQFCQVKSKQYQEPQITRSVVINTDLTWQVFVCGRQVPATCTVIRDFPANMKPEFFLQVLEQVGQAVLCPGNPEEELICDLRVKVPEALHSTYVLGTDGREYCSTLRAPCCVLLQEKLGGQLRRCKQCQSFRTKLRVMKSRNSECSTTGRTAHDSHTNYRFLTEDEKIQRMKNLQDAKRTAQRNESRLRERVIQKINEEGVLLSDEDSEDIAALVYTASDKIKEDFPDESVPRILWEEQLKFHNLKDHRGMKWHPLIIRLALNLHYVSSGAYRAVTRSGL